MSRSQWLDEIENAFVNRRLTSVQVRTFRPDRLIKMASWIEKFEPECSACQKLKKDIDGSLEPLRMNSRIHENDLQRYLEVYRELTSHLKGNHHLVLPSYYSSLLSPVFTSWY